MNRLLADGMKGLILDLRFNPGGRLDQAIQIVDLFVDKGVIVSTKGRIGRSRSSAPTEPGTLPYFPMIVLVNEHSASASEIVAGSLMDNKRALVIGTRTYGKGSVQEVIPLDSKGGELKLTVAYYYLPSGRLRASQEGRDRLGRAAADRRADGRDGGGEGDEGALRPGAVPRPVAKSRQRSRPRSRRPRRRRSRWTCSFSARSTRWSRWSC